MTAMAWKTALQLTGVSQALYSILDASVSYFVRNVELKNYTTKMFLQPKELPVDGLELHRSYPWRSHSLCGVRKNPCIRFSSFFSVNKDSTGVGYSMNDQFCEPIRELLSRCHI